MSGNEASQNEVLSVSENELDKYNISNPRTTNMYQAVLIAPGRNGNL